MASSRTVTTPDGNMVTRLPKATRMDLVIGTLALRPYVFAFLALFLVAGFLDVGWRRTLVFGAAVWPLAWLARSEEHTSELQSRLHLVCRLLLEKKKRNYQKAYNCRFRSVNMLLRDSRGRACGCCTDQ